MSSSSSRLIVALDLPDRDQALLMATQLRPHVGMVKVGLEAYVAHGPDFVRRLVGEGIPVFLDLKLHDIPRTAGAAARETRDLGVRLLTVHAAGGGDMVRAVVDSVDSETRVIAVTVLTSLSSDDVYSLGWSGTPAEIARGLGTVARKAGAHGLVCSPHELDSLRPLGGDRVVPGVRPQSSGSHPQAVAKDDQQRVATPEEAIQWGATWVVVGRPILQASDPIAAARALAAGLKKVDPPQPSAVEPSAGARS